jgi:hypothetical protein
MFVSNAEDMRKLAVEIISSYESRISAVCAIIDNTHQLLDDFKEKRSAMSIQIKETLAHEKSLRKKDFDTMMKDIVESQETMENETRILLRTYLDEQKEAAKTIRENLEKHKEDGVTGESDRINDFRKLITDIQVTQKSREEEVRDMLTTFHNDHKMLSESLRSLLEKGTTIRIRDVKIMLENMRSKRMQWREEVKQAASQWSELAGSMAVKREERRNAYMATAETAPGFSVNIKV